MPPVPPGNASAKHSSYHNSLHKPRASNGSSDSISAPAPGESDNADLFRDGYVINTFAVLAILGATAAVAVFYLPLSLIIAPVAAGTFVLWRHFSLMRSRSGIPGWALHEDSPYPNLERLPSVYFLYVLGSGGHTTEMCQMIKRQFRGRANMHRRYVTTTGDTHSATHIAALESLIGAAYADERAGTWDHVRVERARAVHQPFYTAWYTSIRSAVAIVGALTTEPGERPRERYGRLFQYPHVVVTNGPGTGFVLCLVAHLLKILYLAPQNRLKLVYVESWAHTQTLSLTGKLFHRTGIADLFCVQHRSLANKFGKHYVGVT